MRYAFDPLLLTSIQTSFETATARIESLESSDPDHRDYFFLAFCQYSAAQYEEKQPSLIDVILRGDQTFSTECSAVLYSTAKIEAGFRWKGIVNTRGEKYVVFLGFCIKIIYAQEKSALQRNVIQQLCDFFKTSGLIKPACDLEKAFRQIIAPPSPRPYFFSRRYIVSDIRYDFLEAAKTYICEHIRPTPPAYSRENERSINPVYQNIADVRERLYLHEKKIWLLRSDFILAVGNKQAYWASFAENSLPKAISPRLHRFVNWEDRYGHPSLACAHPGYQSDAFYGGLLAQRKEYLEIYTASGRYYRNDLDEKDKMILEAYIAYALQKSYGDQLIVFREAPSNQDYFECSIFYHDGELPDYCEKREYDFSKICSIFERYLEHRASLCDVSSH